MSAWQKWRAASRLLMVALLGCGLVSAAPRAGAADLTKIDSALKWVPANAAFYSSLLRNREQFDIVAKSKAWATFIKMPVVQDLWKKAQDELKKGGQLAQLQEALQQPENRELLDLLSDMVAHEIFIYGGDSCVAPAGLLMQTFAAVQYAPYTKFTEKTPVADEDLYLRAVLATLNNHLDAIKVPDLVIGFKLSETRRAGSQLKRLEALAQLISLGVPELKGRWKREKVAGVELLTLSLDGKQVPWQQIPFQQVEKKPGEFEPLIKKLNALKLTITLGVRDKYLLLSIGETSATTAQLGKGKGLAQRPEMQPLGRFAGERLAAISYVSQAFLAKLDTNRADIDRLVKLANDLLGQVELTPAQRAQIQKDLADMAKDVKASIPRAGALMSFAFLNSRGVESYSYDWSEQLYPDGSKPLTILNHVGGSPLLAVVGRTKVSGEGYQKLVRWYKLAYQHFEQIVLPMMDANQKAEYQKFVQAALPILQQFDRATAKMLLPALADGQKGFVLDAHLTSKQWSRHMPESDKPLPLLEPSLVLGLSDAALFEKALGEYRLVLNDLLAKASDVNPNNVPNVQLPEPEARKLKLGTMYYYRLPDELQLDKRLLPNAGISDKWAVTALSQQQTERLLTRTPLKVDGGPLAKLDRNLAGATYVRWPALIDALGPWVEYGINSAGPALTLFAGDQGVEGVLKQVRTGMELLKVLRSYTSCTYVEDQAMVTHSETIYRDLE